MNNKFYALMLTAPLLFSACNSNLVTPKVTETTNTQITETIQEKVAEIVESNTNSYQDIVVSYANDKELVKNEGMMNIESFMETLKPTLISLMKSDKTGKTAMGGCTSMAPSMTDDYNKISKTKIRRTALKYRSEKNAPDATDTVVMEGFVKSKNFKEAVVVEMSDHFRVYKALPVKKPCLKCHGENISEDLTKMIERSYPQDMATNFKLGEFRGVVVAKVKK